jgi:hypothetical protein
MITALLPGIVMVVETLASARGSAVLRILFFVVITGGETNFPDLGLVSTRTTFDHSLPYRYCN